MTLKLPRIYPITDTRLSGLSHTEQVRRLAAGGATLVQIREKYLSPREWIDDVVTAVKVGKSLGVKIIINDRVDIAMAAGADGVHLGQDDIPPAAARRLLGRKALIGYSTHHPVQAKDAMAMPIDYIALGPIFPTKTKDQPDPVVGLDTLKVVRHMIGDLPLVAIGGIMRSDLQLVFDAGADSAAMISALVGDGEHITNRFSELSSIVD